MANNFRKMRDLTKNTNAMLKDETRIKETLAIIEALAEGVNPVTGEIFPDQSPYNEPTIIRALFTAGQLLRQQLSQSGSLKPLPAKAGRPWDADEDRDLSEEFKANLAIGAMAEKHQRTMGAIQSRLVRLGLVEPLTSQQSSEVTSVVPKQWWKEQGRTQTGKPWTKEEDETLRRDFQSAMPFEILAEGLKRGINAVEVRLAKLGMRSAMP